MSKPESKKSSSAGGGAAASKSPAPAASSAAPVAGNSSSPLDAETRARVAAVFEGVGVGVDPDHIWGYREYDDHHVIVVMDGRTTTKFMVAK